MNAELAAALLNYRKITSEKLELFSEYLAAKSSAVNTTKAETAWLEVCIQQKEAAFELASVLMSMYRQLSDSDLEYIINNQINIDFLGLVTIQDKEGIKREIKTRQRGSYEDSPD